MSEPPDLSRYLLAFDGMRRRMSVMATDGWAAVRAEIEAAAQDDTLSPEARLMRLSLFRDDLLDLLGAVDTYRGDLGLVQEGREPAYRAAVLEARQDAEIRALMVARGLASESELDALGYPSHDDLDKLDEEGLLESWLGETGRIEEGLWDELKHPRGRGGKFTDILGRVIATKGRHGKSIPMPQGVIPHEGKEPLHLPGDHVIAGGKPGHIVRDLGDGQVRVHHYETGTHETHRADEVVPHPDQNREDVTDVGSDVALAAKLLGEGKRVRLDQPHQVSTLLDKLAEVVQESKRKGEKAPNFDLCKVSVKGTNLFCAQSRNVERVMMPQFKGTPKPGSKADALPKDEHGRADISQQFREHIQSLGVKITRGETRADFLRASQSELNGALVAHLAKQMEEGKRDNTPIFTSREDYILDGHHRWAATVGVDLRDGKPGSLKMPTESVDMEIGQLLEEARKFTDDWGMARQDASAAIMEDYAKARAAGLDEHPQKGAAAQQILGDASDTRDLHTISVRASGGQRVYTPERQQLHDKIIDTLLRERQPVVNGKGETEMHPNPVGTPLQPPSGNPHVLFMAGGTAPLALDTRIATPSGWSTMGALEPGDYVFGADGQPTQVTEVSPVFMDRECFEVEFDDGSRIVADADHRWTTSTRRSRISAERMRRFARVGGDAQSREHLRTHDAVLTTAEIAASLVVGSGKHVRLNHAVEMQGALKLAEAVLPIDPYVLGAWLGDGTSRDGEIESEDMEIIDRIRACGYETRRFDRGVSRSSRYRVYGLRRELREAGLLRNKHIPSEYLRASEEQRRRLLAGLIDTDGTITASGVRFDTTSPRLRDGMTELLSSLGVKHTVQEGRATFEGRDYGPRWYVNFSSTWRVPLLARKREQQRLAAERGSSQKRYIVAVHPAPSVPVRCITVESESHLFLAGESMIPTHNSGKSSALALKENADVVPKGAVFVDPDEIKTMIPEYVKMVQAGDRYAAQGAHEESSDISKRLLHEAMKRGLNVVRDGTGDSPNPRKFAGQIEEMARTGYLPHVLYVNAPTDTAIERAGRRAQQTGRYVPESEIRTQHLHVSRNFESAVRPLVHNGTIHSIRMYDTENGAHLFASGGAGSLQVYEPGLFKRFVDKGTEGDTEGIR